MLFWVGFFFSVPATPFAHLLDFVYNAFDFVKKKKKKKKKSNSNNPISLFLPMSRFSKSIYSVKGEFE